MATEYDPSTEHDPLFDMTADFASHTPVVGEPKPVTSALCPECNGNARTGLLRQGRCLVWRDHTYTTWAGTPMPCRASGVPVCRTGTRGGDNADKAKCLHGASS